MLKLLNHILILYFILGSFLPKSDFGQFGHLSDLLGHYKLHCLELSGSGQELSFIDFLYAHLIETGKHQHNDENEHKDLPFHSISGDILLFITLSLNEPAAPVQNLEKNSFTHLAFILFHLYSKSDFPPAHQLHCIIIGSSKNSNPTTMKLYYFISALMVLCQGLFAQNQMAFRIVDAASKEALVGVNVYVPGLDKGSVTSVTGECTLSNIPDGEYSFSFSYIGYENQTLDLVFPYASSSITIELNQNVSDLEEVIVSSNRANRSIAQIPSRIEVLTDEVEEAATMDPSKIAHLLMHTTGVQVQQTSATSGSASVRIQGQYGRYTQILKDGFPIYGGFTGGLGVLQIPPLDLRQVEFVKGSSSTLYGGGAIAGLINLISKVPKEEEECSVHLNLSHIGNTDLNSFYSKKNKKWGLTIFTSNNTNKLFDVDDDGFTDVPQVRKFNFNPKLFYYLDEQTTISFGGTFTNENRIGGDVKIVEGAVPDSLHNFFERNKSKQVTTQFLVDRKLNKTSSLQFKNSTNRFNRNIFLDQYSFAGTQFSTFSEVNYALERTNAHLIIGANVYSDDFKEESLATDQLRNQDLITFGLFGQYIWDLDEKIAIETGFRMDYNTDYGFFPLPKVAIIYKPGLKFSARLGGGLGYKLPSVFTEEVEALAFEGVLPIDADTNEAEKSYGINADFTYRIATSEKLSISLTEYLFYNRLDEPLILASQGPERSKLINSEGYFETQGIESLIKASSGHFHLYLGYTYVDAIQRNDDVEGNLPLTPKHSFHGDLMFVEEGKWRMGIDAEYESRQTLASGRQVRSLFKAGFLAERTIKNISIYVNLENWTDTRQTRYESLVLAPNVNPRFTEVWAPLDGFIFNAGFKIKL